MAKMYRQDTTQSSGRRDLPEQGFIITNVLVLFEDGSESFCVPRGATLTDISDKLESVSRWHDGLPIAVDLRFKAPEEGADAHRL